MLYKLLFYLFLSKSFFFLSSTIVTSSVYFFVATRPAICTSLSYALFIYISEEENRVLLISWARCTGQINMIKMNLCLTRHHRIQDAGNVQVVFPRQVAVCFEEFHKHVSRLHVIREPFAEIMILSSKNLAQPCVIGLFGVAQKMVAMS